jgi:hypothetical protein
MIALALKAERWRRYRRPAAWTAAWIALGAIAGLTIASVALYALALWRLPEVRSRLLYAGLAVVLAAEALTILQALVGVTIGTAGLAMSIASTGWLNREWLKGQWAETLHLRDWRNACQRCGLWEPATTTRPGRSEPRLLAVTATPTGTRLHVRLHSGWSPPDVQRAADRLASFYHARRVTVALDPADAGALDVTIVRHDPLAGAGAAWPLRDAQRVSLWEPIPVAVDESGATVCVSLPGKHLLLGGQPGAGKSGSGSWTASRWTSPRGGDAPPRGPAPAKRTVSACSNRRATGWKPATWTSRPAGGARSRRVTPSPCSSSTR